MHDFHPIDMESIYTENKARELSTLQKDLDGILIIT